MWDKIKQFFIYASEAGLRLPAAYDADKPGPSVSLLFAHISFYIALGTIIGLSIKDTTAGTIAATMFAGLYFIFYMLRRLTKAKLDFDDKSIDLENDEDEKPKDENEK